MTNEEFQAAILAELHRLSTNGHEGAISSIAVEDLAKGDPKVTSKTYLGSPLTEADVDQVLSIHAYAHRRAAELAMNGWAETLGALNGGKA